MLLPLDASYIHLCAHQRLRERCIVPIDVPCMLHPMCPFMGTAHTSLFFSDPYILYVYSLIRYNTPGLLPWLCLFRREESREQWSLVRRVLIHSLRDKIIWGWRSPLPAYSKVGMINASCVSTYQCEWHGIIGTAGLGYWTHEPNRSLTMARLDRP